ncbi:hypothetical protein AOQ84DRAFT_84392 [Glonium stellatum]|uniref:Uncharacterized protein n=1 Tax=Glonium stellatum TaxID=574774 RepID=A0A8E2JQV9_9PEZI|nr:hypothetical protein AOQ84DRAFT_84392 [Glonium stellatum]
MPTIATLKPILATEGVPKYEGSAGYDGPSPGWLIANHKLAHQIIACHPIESMKVLDSPNLVLLRQYIENPADAKGLLKEHDMVDIEGDKPGTRASQKYGSLVGYVIASNAFDEGEIKLLKDWFDSGVLDKELKSVESSGAGKNVRPEWNGD